MNKDRMNILTELEEKTKINMESNNKIRIATIKSFVGSKSKYITEPIKTISQRTDTVHTICDKFFLKNDIVFSFFKFTKYL